ncbi:RdgB/HAM1 family non-canonical purine NTP pyrophosphatase [Varunaivibrio sulfuroxidans]|uniref:dITP/XTP pyrophosphatase n=1 Tax=Varunaivibrio sulfuroxidans TaxID=1773489 RepID=A0A4R3JGA4_9PROT|nr:RdgB/HAM1 family non-canonical purine NTP pyrophosphatase [Varunaivibrio sulfuroxidans]TCS64907.1 XTP/dITP diphosphohydrolase [Varunaivibrio sulfuroxidans]WES29799.1 RdgB/HAM1 family non-canonical purine NTP pyrophosphatase [Varunaivibrio sulfuroxidans]
MTRRFEGGKLVIASHNAGKVREIDALLRPLGADVVSAGDLGLGEPVEDGATFVANAEIKARAAAAASGAVALADDSGLCVDALDGDPGIFSARWAGPGKDFAAAMAKIEDALARAAQEGRTSRRAHFVCALSLCWPDGHCESVEGKVFGVLVWPMRGQKGFGYDPIFLPDGHHLTFGEMEPDAKHAISHRANAFNLLTEACF